MRVYYMVKKKEKKKKRTPLPPHKLSLPNKSQGD